MNLQKNKVYKVGNLSVANQMKKMKIYRWVWVNVSVRPGSTEPGFILMKSDKYFSS